MTSHLGRKSILAAFVTSMTACVFLTSCGSIDTAPSLSSTAQLSPNPPVIFVAPFRTHTAKWLAGQNQWYAREGWNFETFKVDYQNRFQEQLIERLMKVAPARKTWGDDLPDEGWMVTGDFLTVYQGSRFLRGAIGFGAGETTLQTKVYVYDLSRSKTEYVLSFYTGVVNEKGGGGSGSGQVPGLIAGNVYGAGENTGAGLTLDGNRTAREIRDILMAYK
jgi:hypothetical protein